MVISLYSTLFWELRDKRNFQKFRILIYTVSNVAKHRVMFVHVTVFCSQVFKTSDVLHSDENIVNIALIAFCLLAVTKLADWPMSSLLLCGVGLWSIVCYSFRLF